jgi:DNA polymerase IV
VGLEQCTVLHVDMDAFFAAVEVLDHPALAGIPVIVGGAGNRGVVASCTYEARAFGVRSAMSSVEARRRCPQAVFVSGRYWRYTEVSGQLHEVLRSYTPIVEAIGLDEAFLDVSGTVRLLGSPLDIAKQIRAEVRDQLQLNCSVGVARSKLMAKLASEAAKPVTGSPGPRPGAGVLSIAPENELAFLHPLPIGALWGVGPATAGRLHGLGVATVGDLAAVPEDTLCRLLGSAHGRHLAALARAEDDRPVVADREAKSIGHEETFASDLHDHELLHPHVVRMADALCERLREAGVRARTVTVKIRFGDRTTITRAHTLTTPTGSARLVREVAVALLQAVDVGPGVRLLGVSASGLTGAPGARQLTFEELADAEADDPGDSNSAWEEVEVALSAIRARYGQAAVAPAALIRRGAVSVKRRGDTQWGPGSDPGPAQGPPR